MNSIAQKLINYVHDHQDNLMMTAGIIIWVPLVFWFYTLALMGR